MVLVEGEVAAKPCEVVFQSPQARVMRYGEISDPILVKTLPPLAFFYGGRDRLIQHSRERFGIRREVMERKIDRWMRH